MCYIHTVELFGHKKEWSQQEAAGAWFGNGSFLEKTGLWLLFPSMIMVTESLFGISSFQSVSRNCPVGDVWLYAKPSPNAWRRVRLYSSNETGRHPWGVRNLYTGSLDCKGFPCLAFHNYNLLKALVGSWLSFSFYRELTQFVFLSF